MLFISRFLASQLTSSLRRSFWHSRRERVLVTFDFDKTIIEDDCYTAVSQLLAPEQRTEQLSQLIQQCGWIAYIREVLQLLQREQGQDQRPVISAEQIGQRVRRLPAVAGMLHLLRRLERHPRLEMCIMSDANSYFIGEWLAAHGVTSIFPAIYTNPACVQPDGRLLVAPYEQQTHCVQCPGNLCKGGVMSRLMKSPHLDDGRIIYVGDSCNDLCAIRCLRAQDIACIRRGEELFEKLPAHRHELSCLLLHWRDGHELEDLLFGGNAYL